MAIQEILESCTVSDLEGLVGQKIVSLVSKWNIVGKNDSYKRTLAKTILGTSSIDTLMKSDSFRYLIFDHFARSPEEANSLKKIKWKQSQEVENIASKLGINYEQLFQVPPIENRQTVNFLSNNNKFYELFDYQFVIKQRTVNELRKSDKLKKLILQMPTGTGKTKTAMHIIIDLLNDYEDFTVVWMAHTSELLEQAYDTFNKTFGHIGKGSISCIRLWGESTISEKNFANRNIIFTGMQKLSSIKKNNTTLFSLIVDKCKLLVVDEAHKAAAPDTRDTINKFVSLEGSRNDRSLLGLTATPGRSNDDDEENKKLVSMFDNRIFQIEPKFLDELNLGNYEASNIKTSGDIIEYLQSRQILSRLKKEELSYVISEEEVKVIEEKIKHTSDDIPEEVRTILSEKIARNTAILDKLRILNSDKTPTIVFATTVEQGKLLSAALNNENIGNVCVFGDMDSTTQRTNISSFRSGRVNIIINFGVLTTGFDSTNIKCVLIARPTNSVVLYSQMIGRGLRGPKMGGNSECLLIDVKDNLGKYNENLAFRKFNSYWNK